MHGIIKQVDQQLKSRKDAYPCPYLAAKATVYSNRIAILTAPQGKK